MSARTPGLEKKYQSDRAAGLLVPLHKIKAIREWDHWKLIHNQYPHDKLNVKHNLIVLKRPAHLWDMYDVEWRELYEVILPSLDDQYDYVKLNMSAMRSINTTPHFHACIYREEYR